MIYEGDNAADLQEAYDAGYEAGMADESTYDNPYNEWTEDHLHNAWLDGFNDAIIDEDVLDDGQPDEMQEWYDFDPDC